MTAVLNITDGTTTINLIGTVFRLVENPRWRPQTPQYKGGGVWQNSPFADGRQLAQTRYDNIIDSWTLHVVSSSQDDVIYSLQELRRLLTKGVEYWTTSWQNEPVWIEARASCETNTRYAIVKSFQMQEDDDPYQTPFLVASPGVAMNDIPLVIEHGIWTDTPPGIGTATETSGLQRWCSVKPLVFDGIDDYLTLGSPAILDNLHDNAFTVEAWIRPDSNPLPVIGVIAGKRYWYFRNNTNLTLTASISCAISNGVQVTTTTIPIREWTHVAMTWDDTTYLRPRIWINGVEAAYNAAAGSSRNGAIVSDAAENLLIGQFFGSANPFLGNIGWLRISNSIRYTAPFTPATRCVMPTADANTVWLGIVEGTGATCYDRSGNGNNGIISSAAWDKDNACCEDYGRSATTTDEVYITNHEKIAQLTHVFYYDASVPSYSANLLGQPRPYALFPAIPAAGDICYFGIDSNIFDAGPFSSLIFDIGTAGPLIVAYEYWNGAAWIPLFPIDTTTDGVSSFAVTGVNSICWVQPLDWATGVVNGVTGYWFRIRVLIDALLSPTQQNRNVYTISRASFDIDISQLRGDIPSLLTIYQKNISGVFPANTLWHNNAIFGVRSLRRGSDFSAYINVGSQIKQGISIVPGLGIVSVADMSSQTGRSIYWNPAGATSPEIELIRIEWNRTLAAQYIGRYRFFLRCRQSGGTAGDITILLRIQTYNGGAYIDSRRVTMTQVGVWELLDFGNLTFPVGNNVGDSPVINMANISVYASNLDTPDLYISDLIMIPSDEFVAEFIDTRGTATSAVAEQKRLYIDSIEYPKQMLRAFVLDQWFGEILTIYTSISNGPATLQANESQRIWVLSRRGSVPFAEHEISCRMQIKTQARYFSMRGNR